MTVAPDHRLEAWSCLGLLFERFTRLTDVASPLPAHAYPEYQIGLHVNAGGYYRYRGVTHAVPIAGVSVLHGGEAHQTGNGRYLSPGACFLTLYADPAFVETVVEDSAGRPERSPCFGGPVWEEPALADALFRAHRAAAERDRLGTEEAVLGLLGALLERRRDAPPTRSLPRSPTRGLIERTREYLRANLARRDVTLQELASLAGVTRHHFCHEFARCFGVSPHRYLVLLKVAHAKRLLLQGVAVEAVAQAVGFADAAHLTRHFARVVGVTPGRYRAPT